MVNTVFLFLQILELCVYYSMYPTDHNVVNAALEVFQQLLKMRDVLLAIPALSCSKGLQGTRISSRGLLKTNSSALKDHIHNAWKFIFFLAIQVSGI